jgi:hypothetical protein
MSRDIWFLHIVAVLGACRLFQPGPRSSDLGLVAWRPTDSANQIGSRSTTKIEKPDRSAQSDCAKLVMFGWSLDLTRGRPSRSDLRSDHSTSSNLLHCGGTLVAVRCGFAFCALVGPVLINHASKRIASGASTLRGSHRLAILAGRHSRGFAAAQGGGLAPGLCLRHILRPFSSPPFAQSRHVTYTSTSEDDHPARPTTASRAGLADRASSRSTRSLGCRAG